MTLSITAENKTDLAITNETKPSADTWVSTPGRIWAHGGTWEQPGTVLIPEAKVALTITNETKL